MGPLHHVKGREQQQSTSERGSPRARRKLRAGGCQGLEDKQRCTAKLSQFSGSRCCIQPRLRCFRPDYCGKQNPSKTHTACSYQSLQSAKICKKQQHRDLQPSRTGHLHGRQLREGRTELREVGPVAYRSFLPFTTAGTVRTLLYTLPQAPQLAIDHRTEAIWHLSRTGYPSLWSSESPKNSGGSPPPRDQHARTADAHAEAELPEGGCEACRCTQCAGMGDEGDAWQLCEQLNNKQPWKTHQLTAPAWHALS